MHPNTDQSADDPTRIQLKPPPTADTGPAELAPLRTALAGRYRLEREIGIGGMGRVYLATDLALERRVALKTILPAILADAAWVARFRLEAALAAGLTHPNLIQVYEILRLRSGPVLVMEYVEGDSLAAAVAARRFDQHALCGIMAAVCDGVAQAHAHGVIHCDIKPANILIDGAGVPKLGDFGLAVRRAGVLAGPDGPAPEALEVSGTPAYMAPEQALGDPRLISDRTDVYALGATLYFGLSGKKPVTGESATQVLERVRDGAVEPLRRLAPAIDRDLEAICLKAMRRDPARRYASVRELGADLRAALARCPISARRYGLRESLGRAVRARKETFALGLAMLLAMAIGLAGAVSALYATANAAAIGQLRRTAMDLASTATLLVDPELVQAVDGPDPARLPEARRLAARLDAIRSRSREDVQYVWVMRQREPGSPQMEFVASSESFLPPRRAGQERRRPGRRRRAARTPGRPLRCHALSGAARRTARADGRSRPGAVRRLGDHALRLCPGDRGGRPRHRRAGRRRGAQAAAYPVGRARPRTLGGAGGDRGAGAAGAAAHAAVLDRALAAERAGGGHGRIAPGPGIRRKDFLPQMNANKRK